jgi:hypothetical protein
MNDEKPSGVKPFEIGGVVFRCFVAQHKDGTTYVWRSQCGSDPCPQGAQSPHKQCCCERLAVGRIGHKVWARIDGSLIGDDLGGLNTAMGIAALRLTALQQVAA